MEEKENSDPMSSKKLSSSSTNDEPAPEESTPQETDAGTSNSFDSGEVQSQEEQTEPTEIKHDSELNNPRASTTNSIRKSQVAPIRNSSNAGADKIILGEREKEYFKKLADRLLTLGQEILQDFVKPESPSQDGQQSRKSCSKEREQNSLKRDKMACASNKQSTSRPMSSPPGVISEGAKCDTVPPTAEFEQCQRKFMEAFLKMCEMLGDNPNNAKFDDIDECETDMEMEQEDKNPTEEKIEKLEQTVATISDRVGGLEAKFTDLDSSICQILETLLKQISALVSKVQCLEKGVLQTTKVVEELQAASRLQMHLGNVPLDELRNAQRCSRLETEINQNQNTETNNDAACMTTTPAHPSCVAALDVNRFKNLVHFGDDNEEQESNEVEGEELTPSDIEVQTLPTQTSNVRQ